ncbi:uncharacterized protein HKW66_Vig0025740 [Vigna angularis]|uniref:Uncharacterized protein n=1 Tax=Phaseolus angularis TaxID=3914 RepID=A0A8T0L849_PHAAN|nr:uncharacterized protein HKW66_Vig0025740 [Vigna angularis]
MDLRMLGLSYPRSNVAFPELCVRWWWLWRVLGGAVDVLLHLDTLKISATPFAERVASPLRNQEKFVWSEKESMNGFGMGWNPFHDLGNRFP